MSIIKSGKRVAFLRRWDRSLDIKILRKVLAQRQELALLRAVPELQDGTLREAAKQLGHLRLRVAKQAKEIRTMQKVAEYRNKQLASLHVVWCNGGCEGGVGCKDAVTRDVVLEAVRNVTRLVDWWNNHAYRQGADAYEAQKVEIKE